METLKNYTFLPWLRQGIATEISVPDALGKAAPLATPQRAKVPVTLKLNDETVPKVVELLGPGDVLGLNPLAVVKTEPRNLVTDFEANYLAYIEFYEEDFPWRFTPVKAAGELTESRLRPWIFLIVLEEGEFEEKRLGAPLPAFEIKADVSPDTLFPNREQTWAWAHVHVSRNIIGGKPQTTSEPEARTLEQTLASTLAINPDNASSRLLSPRKLKENTAYHAFVIPAFETGRLAGLGLPLTGVDGQLASWGAGQRLYPIYYRWSFSTGTKGDFEFLVDLLEPRRVDKSVGVREMDMQEPGYEVDGMAAPLDVMGLEGALKSTETESLPPQWPPAGTVFENPPEGSAGKFLNQLEDVVNMQFDIQQEETADKHPDPIVSPPLYGKWYAKAEKLEARNGAGWVNELNRDPRLRVPAGIGTKVIQKNQERLMQQAWRQLGDLLRANQKIRQLQLGWMSSFRIYQKNVLPQSSDRLLAFTQLVHARALASPATIARQVSESRLPQAALDPSFRKITRSRGAIMRKVAPGVQASAASIITKLNEGTLTAAPAPPEPVGQISLDAMADTLVPKIPEWLRLWLRKNLVRRALILLLALALALLILSGAFMVYAAVLMAGIIIVLVALLFIAERLRAQLEAADALHESNFKPGAVDEIPARPNFVQTEFEAQMPGAAASGSADSVEAANFRIALKDAFNVYQSPPPPEPVRQPLNIGHAVFKLRESINPAVAIPKRAEFVLQIPGKIKDSYLRPHETPVLVMAHPVFAEPMYRPLLEISPDLLVPNLHLIPNNTISLLETNQRFIEAYMVGLNHEMGCELLWREFPTDQRGSYFRQFWDVAETVNRDPGKTAAQIEEASLDIKQLHLWERATALGTHENRPLPTGAEPGESRLALVVRGDLLKKYPTAVIYAQQAKWAKDEEGRDIRVLDESKPEENIKVPIFKAEIEPEIRFLGFDLTASRAKGDATPLSTNPGWFFVIQERPGEPRFGLDNLSSDAPETVDNWNKLAWEHLDNFASLVLIDFNRNTPVNVNITESPDHQFEWGRNAADMAYILYQVPVMVAFHGADMLP
ncbi:MAG TPA: hypothetical protein VF553_20925 [Pyrinomonadaceae bacterium]|jgi:hypothetical protein